jgi:hypothetical protein
MNHFRNYMPPRDMDPDYGPDLSDAAEDALMSHHIIQMEIACLLKELKSSDGLMGMDRYEALLAELEDATRTQPEMEAIVYEIEEDRRADARAAYAEMKIEQRRDEEMGL